MKRKQRNKELKHSSFLSFFLPFDFTHFLNVCSLYLLLYFSSVCTPLICLMHTHFLLLIFFHCFCRCLATPISCPVSYFSQVLYYQLCSCFLEVIVLLIVVVTFNQIFVKVFIYFTETFFQKYFGECSSSITTFVTPFLSFWFFFFLQYLYILSLSVLYEFTLKWKMYHLLNPPFAGGFYV